ncbi:MAG TPA: hypothetical protein VLY84_03090 [Dysgonamonadaceae bacterium]|nr:hypothetical protein [Dysgonamonadaceae bacterium]
MRIIRLVLGIVIIVQGIQTQQWMLVVLGGLFTLMPVFNIGCCSTAGCSTRSYDVGKNEKSQEITFEEVNSKR